MKIQILLSIIVSFLFGNISSQNKKSDYEIYFKKENLVRLSDDKLLASGFLINNTNDTLKYKSMSCSWQEIFETNNLFAEIEKSNCDKNFPIIEKIPPKGKKAIELRIIITETCCRAINFKVRANLIGKEPLVDDKTVWSNRIHFKKASQ